MKQVLVVASTYVELDQFKIENNLYTKTDHYKREGVGEYFFVNHKDPKFNGKLRGLRYHDVIFLGDKPDGIKMASIANHIIPEL